MADLSNLLYSSLQTAVGDWIARADLTSNIPDFITLFEAEANRTLRVRQMETVTLLYPTPANQYAVTSVTSDGSGHFQVTFTNTSTGKQNTGDEIFLTGAGGSTSINNTWLVTAVSSVVYTLQNSTFAAGYTSGGTATSLSGMAALPSDYLTWRRLTWTGTPNKVVEYMQPDMLRIAHPIITSADLLLDSDYPSMFTVEGPNIVIRPVDTTALELDYYQKIPALASQTSSSNWLLTAYPDVYLSGALAECYVFQRDWDEAGLWKQRRDDMLDRITRLDQKTRGPSYVRPDMRGMIP